MQDFRRENRFPAFIFSVFFISILLLSVYFFLCLSQSILKTCVYRIPVASVLFYIVKGLIRPLIQLSEGHPLLCHSNTNGCAYLNPFAVLLIRSLQNPIHLLRALLNRIGVCRILNEHHKLISAYPAGQISAADC